MAKTLEEVLAEVERDDQNKRDFVKNSSELYLDTEGLVHMRGERIVPGFRFSDLSLTQVSNRLGLRRAAGYLKWLYFDLEDYDLVAENLNRHLGQISSDMLLRTRVESENKPGIIRGVLSDQYVKIDNREIFSQVYDLLEVDGYSDNYRVDMFDLGDEFVSLRVTYPDLTEKVGKTIHKKDDELMTGMLVNNSEVGKSRVRFVPIIHRMICSNGLIVPTGGDYQFGKRHINTDLDSVRYLSSVAFDEGKFYGKKKLELMAEARRQRLEDPGLLELIETVCKRKRMSDKLIGEVKDCWAVESDPSVYGFVNAFTRFARDREKIEERIEFEEFAGDLLNEFSRN